MAAQALLSGRQLLGRPVQAVSRSSARKAPFVVRASSSPPAKVCADLLSLHLLLAELIV